MPQIAAESTSGAQTQPQPCLSWPLSLGALAALSHSISPRPSSQPLTILLLLAHPLQCPCQPGKQPLDVPEPTAFTIPDRFDPAVNLLSVFGTDDGGRWYGGVKDGTSALQPHRISKMYLLLGTLRARRAAVMRDDGLGARTRVLGNSTAVAFHWGAPGGKGLSIGAGSV